VLILCINGPNLNVLGRRDPAIYGSMTLPTIEEELRRRAGELGTEIATYQSNHEGALIDYIQEQTESAQGIIINPAALTHYGLSLRDALADSRLPTVEVHISNIHSREPWRAHSVVAPVAVGQVIGLGWRGYLYALELLVEHLKERGAS
jgi:3-dehydroquinate dehydratase-2